MEKELGDVMEYKWNLYKIYESDEKWEEGKKDLLESISLLESSITSLTSSVDDFLKCTKLKVLVDEKIERVYCYPRRFLDLDINDTKHKAMFDEALEIYQSILGIQAKFESIVCENEELIRTYLSNEKASFYTRYYEIIFKNKKHLSKENVCFKNYQDIRNEYQELVSKIEFKKISVNGEEVLVNNNTYSGLLLNEDASVRKDAYTALNEAYLSVADEITDLYIRKLKNDIEDARNKNYSSLMSMKLSELELPDNLIDNTIKAVSAKLDIMHDYILLKKKLSGLPVYSLYDSSMPKLSTNSSSIDFAEAFSLARETLSVLGDEYLKHIDSLIDGSIDAYPKKGKRTNDFTGITYAGIPYICLNFTGKKSGVRNLIHELGHAIHLLYSKENNDFTYFEFSLFLTEVVAKVNEAIFNNSGNLTDADIMGVLSVQLNSIFNQIMFTEFESRVVNLLENNKEINKEIISNIYEELLRKYNGDGLTINEYDKYGWLRISHFIMQEPFYLYQYSLGTMLANKIYQKIISDETIKDTYISMLGIGNKMNIIDSLKSIDIDLFDETIFDDSFNNLNEMIKKLKKVA